MRKARSKREVGVDEITNASSTSKPILFMVITCQKWWYIFTWIFPCYMNILMLSVHMENKQRLRQLEKSWSNIIKWCVLFLQRSPHFECGGSQLPLVASPQIKADGVQGLHFLLCKSVRTMVANSSTEKCLFIYLFIWIRFLSQLLLLSTIVEC